MNPQTAEEINKLDLQNQIDTRTALNTQLNPTDQLRNQRRISAITSSSGITPTTISSANLGQTNPIVLPKTTPSTKATGIIAGINNATQNDLTQQAVANAKATAEAAGVGEAQKQKQTALEYIKGLFGKETTAMQESQTSPEALQIQTENTTLTDLNNKITNENAKLKAEKDAIIARGDISQSAQAGLISNLEDVYGRKLAILSTQKANAIGNITRLKSSLKDSLDMKLAPIEKELQYYKDFELENLKDLSAEEQKTLSNIIAEKTRLETQIKDSHKILETALKSALDNGIKIPDDVVAQMQEDPENSYSILAQNGITLVNPADQAYKYAQAAKLRAEANIDGTSTIKVGADATPNDQAKAQALNIILGSGKFTKDQVKLVTNAINSGQDPFTVIKNQAKNIMGQTEATNLGKYEVAQATLADIGKQLEQFYAEGGKTNIFTGNFEKVTNKLGEVNDPKLVNLATQIQGNLQVYRNAISGTAYSAQEGKDISSIFPGINKSETLNKAILSARNTLFNSVIDSTYRTTLGSAYDELKNTSNTQASDSFATYRSQLKQGEILVKDSKGQIGAIPEGEFDSKLYTKL